MSDKWDNEVVEFIFPQKLIKTIGLCIIWCTVIFVIMKVMDKRDASYFNKEIELAQNHIDNQEYESAYNILCEAYQDNVGKRDEILNPLIEKGDELLKIATSGIFSGYGLPFEGEYEIKNPGYMYFYIPLEGEELYEENSYYFVYSETELLSQEEIIELFHSPGAKIEYSDLKYMNGLSSLQEPQLEIYTCENENTILDMQGRFEYDYSTGEISLGNGIFLHHVD